MSMTFEEWWDSYRVGVCLPLAEFNAVKEAARAAFNAGLEAGKPKWTLFKDGLPTEDGEYFVADHDGDVLRVTWIGTARQKAEWLKHYVSWMPNEWPDSPEPQK